MQIKQKIDKYNRIMKKTKANKKLVNISIDSLTAFTKRKIDDTDSEDNSVHKKVKIDNLSDKLSMTSLSEDDKDSENSDSSYYQDSDSESDSYISDSDSECVSDSDNDSQYEHQSALIDNILEIFQCLDTPDKLTILKLIRKKIHIERELETDD